MRHASIQTTMNVYGRAMSDSKREAHSNVVQMIWKEPSERKISEEVPPIEEHTTAKVG